MIGQFTKSIAAITACALCLLVFTACPHPQNKAPEHVFKNDGYAKTGSGGAYNPNLQERLPEEEVAPLGEAPVVDSTAVVEDHAEEAHTNEGGHH